MHQTTGRWKLGLLLALITAFMWGLLPIAIKVLLQSMDPWTITFYRFSGAALMMGSYLVLKRQLPEIRHLRGTVLGLMIIAIVGLCANYIFFLFGLSLTSAATTQVLIQLAPMLLMFGGLFLFGEHFSRSQWLGFAVFITGLLLFFNRRLLVLLGGGSDYTWGVLAIIAASITWAAYALAQKQLLRSFSSMGIMLIVLLVGSTFFVFKADLGQVATLDELGLGLLLFSSLNTAIAYGAFAEALNHWEASRIGAVLSLTPVITVISLNLLSYWLPQRFAAESLSWLTLTGIAVVVGGSMLTALARRSGKALLEQPTSEL